MAIHKLKTWPPYFQQVKSGKKTFEIRKNDRDFKSGDILILKEWNRNEGKYTGDQLQKEVTSVYRPLPGGSFGLKEGHCVMSIRDHFKTIDPEILDLID